MAKNRDAWRNGVIAAECDRAKVAIGNSTALSESQMEELARGNIERHLGDAVSESGETTADSVFDEAYTLGVDALVDAGVDNTTAQTVARRVVAMFAQP